MKFKSKGPAAMLIATAVGVAIIWATMAQFPTFYSYDSTIIIALFIILGFIAAIIMMRKGNTKTTLEGEIRPRHLLK